MILLYFRENILMSYPCYPIKENFPLTYLSCMMTHAPFYYYIFLLSWFFIFYQHGSILGNQICWCCGKCYWPLADMDIFFLLVGTSAHRKQSQRDNGSPLRMTMHLSSVFSSMLLYVVVSNQETWFVILVSDQKF